MINITNPQAKRLYALEFNRQMDVLANQFYKDLRPLLGRQYYNAASLVQQGVGVDGVDHAVDLGRRRLINIFLKNYKRIFTVFGRKAYNIIDKSQGKKKSYIAPSSFYYYEEQDFLDSPAYKGGSIPSLTHRDVQAIADPNEFKTAKDEFWNSVNNWARTQAASKIQKIQKTTKKTIANVIHKGMQEGESHREIAKRIRKTSAKINPHRARTIALTETHTASVKSVDAAVATTRITMMREWVSSKDQRTRTRGKKGKWEHYAKFPNGPDGEKVAQDGKFVKTGQALSFPGDPSGSVGNIIRCRCVVIYHTAKRMDELKPHVPEGLTTEIDVGLGNKVSGVLNNTHKDIRIYRSETLAADDTHFVNMKKEIQKEIDRLSELADPKVLNSIDEILILNEKNPTDSYWMKKYNIDDFESVAAGGFRKEKGQIVYFKKSLTDPAENSASHLRHEMGHIFAEKTLGKGKYVPKGWKEARKAEGWSSDYALRSNTDVEDFADFISSAYAKPFFLPFQKPRPYLEQFPIKAKIFKDFVKGASS